MSWQEDGRCWALETGSGESDIFFEEWNLDLAKEFCDDCVVRKECLNEGMSTRSSGIWAGTTMGGRRYLREKHNQPERPVSLKVLRAL